MARTGPLTPKQREALYFVALHVFRTGAHPTFLPIAEATGATEGDAMRRAGALISRGFLRLEPGILTRRIRLVRLPDDAPIPLPSDVAFIESEPQGTEPGPITTTNPEESPLLTLFLSEDPQ